MDFFEELLRRVPIFKDESKLDSVFIATKMLYREKELALLSQLFLHLITNPNTISRRVLITGKPNTGKTTTLKSFEKMLTNAADKRGVGVKCVHIDCKEQNSKDKILTSIGNELDFKLYSSIEIIERISYWCKYRERHILLVLDDVEQIVEDLEELLDLLKNINDDSNIIGDQWISIICIASNLDFLGSRKGSNIERLRRNRIEFKPLSREQIFDLLKYRARLGFRPGACSNEIIIMIADQVLDSRDINSGLDLLRQAGKIAEDKKLDQITPECVRLGVERLKPKTM